MRLIKREGTDTILPYDTYRPLGSIAVEIHKPLNITLGIIGITYVSRLLFGCAVSDLSYMAMLIAGTVYRWMFLYNNNCSIKFQMIVCVLAGWFFASPLEVIYIAPLLWYYKKRDAWLDIILDIICFILIHMVFNNMFLRGWL